MTIMLLRYLSSGSALSAEESLTSSIAALFSAGRKWNQSRRSSADKCIDEHQHFSHSWNKVKWHHFQVVEIEFVSLKEVTRPKENKYYTLPFTCESETFICLTLTLTITCTHVLVCSLVRVCVCVCVCGTSVHKKNNIHKPHMEQT